MRKTIYLISLEFFYNLTAVLVIFIFLEIIWPSIVLAYININIVLIFWLIDVSILLISSKNDKRQIFKAN